MWYVAAENPRTTSLIEKTAIYGWALVSDVYLALEITLYIPYGDFFSMEDTSSQGRFCLCPGEDLIEMLGTAGPA